MTTQGQIGDMNQASYQQAPCFIPHDNASTFSQSQHHSQSFQQTHHPQYVVHHASHGMGQLQQSPSPVILQPSGTAPPTFNPEQTVMTPQLYQPAPGVQGQHFYFYHSPLPSGHLTQHLFPSYIATQGAFQRTNRLRKLADELAMKDAKELSSTQVIQSYGGLSTEKKQKNDIAVSTFFVRSSDEKDNNTSSSEYRTPQRNIKMTQSGSKGANLTAFEAMAGIDEELDGPPDAQDFVNNGEDMHDDNQHDDTVSDLLKSMASASGGESSSNGPLQLALRNRPSKHQIELSSQKVVQPTPETQTNFHQFLISNDQAIQQIGDGTIPGKFDFQSQSQNQPHLLNKYRTGGGARSGHQLLKSVTFGSEKVPIQSEFTPCQVEESTKETMTFYDKSSCMHAPKATKVPIF